MNRVRRIKQIFLLATLPLVLLLFFNQAAFWHYHVLENGLVVQHAHPFSNNTHPDTPYQQHQHTDFEYLLLGQISNLAGLLLLVFGLDIIARLSRKNYSA